LYSSVESFGSGGRRHALEDRSIAAAESADDRGSGSRVGAANSEGEPVNKVVARFADGHMVKGMTADFFPNKDLFHVSLVAEAGNGSLEILTDDLKALFFVKDFAGDPDYAERKSFDPARPPAGRRIRVAFKDGEVLVGTTTGYQPGRRGFFLEPADPDSNNERCYVIASAAEDISFL
jgi:hypothetical protein